MADNTQNILTLNHTEAKDFFLKNEHYANIDIPYYFDFTELINKLYIEIEKDDISDLNGEQNKDILCKHSKKKKHNTDLNSNPKKNIYFHKNPKCIENINHEILINKNTNSWRTFTLINPLVYSYLIYEITKLKNWSLILNKLLNNRNLVSKNINCESIPIFSDDKEKKDKASQINHWMKKIESDSLKMALKFNYIMHTDIANCYPSIYTHSIAWAIHGKPESREDTYSKQLIGNKIDEVLQSMSFRQTNGIPQGSTIMDFIAEIVLSEIDKKLFEKIERENPKVAYQILRYRDDYRIFTKNKHDAEIILKTLSEILCKEKFTLNENKTIISQDIIKDSQREIKLFFIERCLNRLNSVHDKLLIIKNASSIYKNQGHLQTILTKIYNNLVNELNAKNKKDDPEILISIITEIAINNPKTYSVSCAIISELLNFIESQDQKIEIFRNIKYKFENSPKASIMELWLQRIYIAINKDNKNNIEFNEKLCKILDNDRLSNDLFDISFIKEEKIINIFHTTYIINETLLEKAKQNVIIQSDEFNLFPY